MSFVSATWLPPLFLNVLGVLCILWIAVFLYLARAFSRLPRFSDVSVSTPERSPKVSVIVPACNEAAHIESAVKTLLAQNYPDLEIILVNDRSTDETGKIIDRLAAANPCIKTIHVKDLPAGWLGKVHALHRGRQLATGEWLLFTDADVHFTRGVLRRAIANVMYDRVDHLALIPRTVQNGFWLDVTVCGFGLLFMLATRADAVNRPDSKRFVGIGAFNLVRADLLDRTAGFEWLRLEPGDDIGLGMMLRQAGGTTRIAAATEELSVGWYPSLGAMFRGLEKNLFGPGSNYCWWLMLLQVGGLWSFAAAPWAALVTALAVGSPFLLGLAIGSLLVQIVFALYLRGSYRSWSVMLFPLGALLIGCMMLRAGFKALRHGGIDWRGTRYPLDQLRKNQRVKFTDFV